jgi:chemotaxis protein CheX
MPEDHSTNPIFQFIESQGYLTLKLWGNCDGASVLLVENEFSRHLEKRPVHLIVNCENLSHLSTEWVRFFLRSQQLLKNSHLSVRFIKLHNNFLRNLRKDGLDSAFKCHRDLREALVELGIASPKRLDTDFINPFLGATIHVLKGLASVVATPGKPYLKKAGEHFTGDVSGVIGIVSESFSGSVVISFPGATFIAVMNSMLGETYTEINSDILDGAGEITNQVFGQAKLVLNEKGYGIKTAIPSVVSGKDHSLTTLTTGPTVVVPFSSKAGDFFVEICISE